MHLNKKVVLWAAVFALALPLMFTGIAGATYLKDGATQNGTTGGWDLPTDLGWCYTDVTKTDRGTCRDVVLSTTDSKTVCTTANSYTISGTPTGVDYNAASNKGRWIAGCTIAPNTNNTEALCATAGGTWLSDGTLSCGGTHVSPTPTDQTSCEAAGGTWGHFTAGTAGGTGVCTGNFVFAGTYSGNDQCLRCHGTSRYITNAAAIKGSYLMTGHKNMLRKVTAGSNWAGPDGVVYTTDGTNTLNFTDASITVSGVKQNLYYLYGDWMAPNPTAVYGTNGFGSAPGATNGYSCAACHTTGYSNSTAGLCSNNTNTSQLACEGAGATWVQSVGVQGTIGAEPQATFPGITGITGSWDLNGIQCSRCHNSTSPAVAGTGTHNNTPSGTAVNNLCFGCHQSLGKVWPAGTQGSTDPTVIPTGVSHGAASGRDFNGHVLGNSFLNSPHARFNGVVVPNKLGKFDISGTYSSAFEGGAGACTTCHDVHQSLYVEGQNGIKEECAGCHENGGAGPQVNEAMLNHPKTAGTPWDTTLYGNDPCAVCHMATQAMKNGNQNSMPVHVWRINTSASYNTFPTADQFNGTNGATKDRNAQTAPETYSGGTYTNAVWVDLDLACGQCHGGSLGVTANSAPALNKDQLAVLAAAMHDNSAAKTNDQCLTCHSSAQGSKRAVNPGVDHHNGSCLTCHPAGANGHYQSAWTTAGVADPNINAVTRTYQSREAPYYYYWGINTSLKTACLGCHSTAKTRSSDGATLGAIVPSGTGDNHHNGHASVPGTNFGGVALDMVNAGSRGDNDPGMNCLGCHGKARITGGDSTTGYTMTFAASGLNTSTVAAQNGRVNTSGLCEGCHEVIQSGTTQDHHAGECVSCHHADGSYSGTYPAGVGTAPAGDPCLNCHATAQGSSRAVNQGVDHHNGTCTACHGSVGGVPAWTIAGVAAPNTNATTLKPAGSHNPLPYWSINTSLATGCLGCHSVDQPMSSATGTVKAIVPSGTGDNHHNGHSSVPGTSFGGVSEENGSRGATDPGMNCLGCHGKSTVVSGNNTTGYIITIAGSGLSTSTVAAQNGRTDTTGLCMGCHEQVQSGPDQNHHAGACLTCHHADGTSNGTYPAGVGTIPAPYSAITATDATSVTNGCQACHASAQTKSAGGSTRAIIVSGTGDNHHKGSGTSSVRSVAACLYCHGEAGGVKFGGLDTEVMIDQVAPNSCNGACHGSTLPTSGKHHTGAGMTPTNGFLCLTCHVPATATDVPSASPGVTDKRFTVLLSDGTTTTSFLSQGWVDCTACHNTVSDGSLNGPGVGHHLTEPGLTACDSCHTNAGQKPSCSNCHTESQPTIMQVSTTSGCEACHVTNATGGAKAGVKPTIAQACDKCHGGATSTTTANGAPYQNEATLTTYGTNIHGTNPTAKFGWSNSTTANYTVLVDASSSTCPSGSCTYNWNFGDNSTGTGVTASHVYSGAGSYTVTLTVGTSTASTVVTPRYVGGTPTALTANVSMNGLTATADYTVTGGQSPYTVKITWGDGTTTSSSSATGPATHSYAAAGTYKGSVYAVDSGVDGSMKTSATVTFSATATMSSVTGTVLRSDNTTAISGVYLYLMQGSTTKKISVSSVTGAYSFTNVPAGSYTIKAVKSGYTFATPAASITVSGNMTQNINSVTP